MRKKSSIQENWNMVFFAQGGFPPDYVLHETFNPTPPVSYEYMSLDLQIYSSGIYFGITTPRFEKLSILSGRGEAISEVIPFWLARYPPQTTTLYYQGGDRPVQVIYTGKWKGANFSGASVTPLILRWNFSQSDEQKVKPWLQMGCGVLWTDHKFPIYILSRNTSVFNFTPQVGAGVDVFRNPKHSMNFGFKFIHISNGSLGDMNPAIHDSLNFSVGYSWWK